MGGTIVCGLTGTAQGRSAAQLAAALAARLESRLVLVHVLACGAEAAAEDVAAGERHEVQCELEAVARAVGGAETRIVVGNRVDGLVRVAADEGADLIVLGSRARGARGRQLRCTLAVDLEAAQGVPVLIAPPATRRRSPRRLALAEAGAER